ncbi:MAG: acyl-CoA thioesterase [Bdellovibrionales bacterium]|nr:acyl-CoA thioesterase [Bdellovibrionales bacterium]
MTEMVLPSHTNTYGSVFGGVVMSWIDIAGAIAAQRHSRRNVVTASIDDLHFLAPVRLGWTVNLLASVNYTSKTSMEVGVKVIAENPTTGDRYLTSKAYLTFVALGSDGKPTKIPQVRPETADERRRFESAQIRRKHRMDRYKEIKAQENA